MKTATQLKPSPATLPNSVKVTLYQGSINLWTAFIYALLFFAAPPVYCYVWEDLPSLSITHLLTGFWSSYLLSMFVFALAANLLISYLTLYFCNGRQTKAIRCYYNRTTIGYYSTRPVLLKRFRLYLLLPGILTGALPFLHGLCTDNKSIYVFGMFGLIYAVNNTALYFKLLPFSSDDLLQSEETGYFNTVIRHYYIK